MLSSLVDPGSITIPTPTQQCQESGKLFGSAMGNHLKMLLLLENSHLQVIDSKDSISGIDSSLRALQHQHNALDKSFHKLRVALAKTRNRLASPIYRFPAEILYQIFLCAIYDLNGLDSRNRLVGGQVRMIYFRLYSLMSVCTVWRNLGLHHPRFWSIVPMVDNTHACWRSMSVDLSFQRSGTQDIHLVLDVAHRAACARREQLLPFLEQASRIKSLDIRSEYAQDIPVILAMFLRHFPKSLSRLSLYYYDDTIELYRRKGFVKEIAPVRSQFTNLMSSLSGFQLCDVPFDWSYIRFSASLVQLRVDRIELPGESAIAEFMAALSSAYQLRELKLIRIEAFVEEGPTLPDLQLVLPHFTSLYLEDLYFNFLEFILASLAANSYHLTLNPSYRVTESLLLDSYIEVVDIKEVRRLLARHSVHKLILSDRHKILMWATGRDLRKLLCSMPTLKTLLIAFYVLDDKLFKALKPPSNTRAAPFPQLETLEFRSSEIPGTITGLKSLAAKHPIKSLVLGQLAFPGGSDELVIHRAKDNRIVRWLRIKVPDFRFISYDINPPEVRDDPWQWSGF